MELLSRDAKPGVPRIIWMLWLQGADEMPAVVRRCYESWKTLNPEWELILLDQSSLADYIDLQPILATDNSIKTQALSDIIRIKLLAEYGGVWIDATCFCCTPLDEWLDEAAAAGFFAFANPRRDKLMDAWFMASHRDCYLTTTLAEATNRYWLENRGLKHHRATLISRALKLLGRSTHTTRFWFSWPVRNLLRAYPYFWLPYLFTELVRKDARFRKIWAETPKISADLPHKLQVLGLLEPLTPAAKSHIDGKESPLYKLTWRFNPSRYTEETTLHYLFSQPYAAKPSTALTDA